ncbi:MAG: GntR family transcriptional regulator [Chloroflexi bacterium]|nr:GntR family transcriptional regulator [Chloroflexota bacterium]
MKLHIEPESKVPIYIQVEEQVRALVAAGQLRPGDQLPTIRELAADLRVNYNTIARIYLDLDRDGIISTQRGRGTFVAGVPDEEQMARARQGKLQAIVRSALDEARALGYGPGEIAEVFEGELARWRAENGG